MVIVLILLPDVDNDYRSLLPLNLYFMPYIITLPFTVPSLKYLISHSISILSFFLEEPKHFDMNSLV